MDEFHFDDRLFYKFNSYNISLLGNIYKGLLLLDTNIPPNEIRKIAFYYDLFFPNKLENANIDIFEKNNSILEKKLYSYFNPWISNSSELYKFYYCFNHKFTKDIYDQLINALEDDNYNLFSKIPKKNILEIYKYLLTFYPNYYFGKTGNLIKDQILKKTYIPILTKWKSPDKKNYLSFNYYKDFYWGNDLQLSKIQRQNIFNIFNKNKTNITEIYLTLNGLKLKNIFDKKIFDNILYYSCKHSNYWYTINFTDYENLLSLFNEFYDYKYENISKIIYKHRREEIQELFCKYENDISDIIKNHKDIQRDRKIFDDFNKNHRNIKEPNILYTIALYYNIMFPNEINQILGKFDSISQNIHDFFDNKNNKDKFMHKINNILKINFSKEFNEQYYKVPEKKTIDDSLTLPILRYIINAYDIFFPNEVQNNNKSNIENILKFFKNNFENVIKLYYICNNKKQILLKDTIFTSNVYYEIMTNSCTYGKDGWWNVSDEAYNNILKAYDYLNIDRNTDMNQYIDNKQSGYNYFIRNKDKLYNLIEVLNDYLKLKMIEFNSLTQSTDQTTKYIFYILDSSKYTSLEEKNNLFNLYNIINKTYRSHNITPKEIIREEKEINNERYYIYKIRDNIYNNFYTNYKTFYEKFPIIIKQINKNFLNLSSDYFKFNIPQDTLLYIAKKYDLEYPNEIKYKNFIIKKQLKFLEFILPEKPLPLLQYLMKFFAKETIKLKKLYEKLNNINLDEDNIKKDKRGDKDKKDDDKGNKDKGDDKGNKEKGDDKGDKEKGDDKGDKGKINKQTLINIVKELANDDARLKTFKNNLVKILNNIKEKINNIPAPTSNTFYVEDAKYYDKLIPLHQHISKYINNINDDSDLIIIKTYFLLRNIDENDDKSFIKNIKSEKFYIMNDIINTFTIVKLETNKFKYSIIKLTIPDDKKDIEKDINDIIRIYLVLFIQLGFTNIPEHLKVDSLNELKINTKNIGKHLLITNKVIEELDKTDEAKKRAFFDFINFYSKYAFVFIINKAKKINNILVSLKNNNFNSYEIKI